MEMKMSAIVDQWTILRMKARLDKDSAEELKLFNTEVYGLLCQDSTDQEALLDAAFELMEVNARIWENEAAMRKEYKNDPANSGKELNYEELGRRSVIIRDFNAIRVKARQKIDMLYCQFPDKKFDHISQ